MIPFRLHALPLRPLLPNHNAAPYRPRVQVAVSVCTICCIHLYISSIEDEVSESDVVGSVAGDVHVTTVL